MVVAILLGVPRLFPVARLLPIFLLLRDGCRLTDRLSLQQLLQLATIQPDTLASGADIDHDPGSFNLPEFCSADRTVHCGLL
jgi:hypothetical protein